MYAYRNNGAWLEWAGQPLPLLADGAVLPVPHEWADSEKRARFGLYLVLVHPIPPGKRVSSYTIEEQEGWPVKVDVYANIAPLVPDRVTARQFHMMLAISGLTAAVDTWVATMPLVVQKAYDKSGTFVRLEPMMQAGFAALGVSLEQIDAFFTEADKL